MRSRCFLPHFIHVSMSHWFRRSLFLFGFNHITEQCCSNILYFIYREKVFWYKTLSSFPFRIVNDNSTSICVTQAKENYRKIAECLNVYFHNSLDCIFYVSFPQVFSFFRNESNGGPLYKSHHSDGMDTAKSSCILFRLSLIHIYLYSFNLYQCKF